MAKVGAPLKRGQETYPHSVRVTESHHRFLKARSDGEGGEVTMSDIAHQMYLAQRDGGPAELRNLALAKELDELRRASDQGSRRFTALAIAHEELKVRHKAAIGKWGRIWRVARRYIPGDILARLPRLEFDGTVATVDVVAVQAEAADAVAAYRATTEVKA